MTWEHELFALLDDLEQQADALHDADRAAELADRSRAAYAEVTLGSRLMAASAPGEDCEVALDVLGVGRLEGRVARVGAGWLLLAATGEQEWMVPTHALLSVRGAPSRAVPELAWSPMARLGLTSALRRLGEAGERCLVHLVDASRLDGVVRRVGADFCELATGAPPQVVLVPFAALSAVQSRAQVASRS